MKTLRIIRLLLSIAALGWSSTVVAQSASPADPDHEQSQNKNESSMESRTMNTYVIEREIPNAGNLNAEELQGISKTSCNVIKQLGPSIEWLHSYVTGNKIFCIYRAESEEILRKHGEQGGFPVNAIHKLSTVIKPATATAPLADIMR